MYVNTQDPTLLDDPSRLFNSDETGFSFDPKGRKECGFRLIHICLHFMPTLVAS